MSKKYVSTHAGAAVDQAVTDVGTLKINVSNLQASKVDKVAGKGLSTNDYDATEKALNASNAQRIKALEDRYKADEGNSLTISASGGTLWYGETKSITISCSTNKTADKIEILNASGTVVATQTSVSSLSYTVSNASAAASFTCRATLNGVTKTTTASISIVYPSYIGSGASYSAITSGTKLSSVTGSKSVSVSTEGHKIFIVTPSTITSVKYNGFELPMTSSTTTMNGRTYNVYTSNALQTGTYNLTIS